MEAFFSRFPEFVYNRRRSAEHEFNRLRVTKGWLHYPLEYKTIYKEFLQSLYKGAGDEAAVHEFFITRYPNFDYKTRDSPTSEFQRLKSYQGWEEDSDEYKRARSLFEDAYDREFIRDVDGFFNSFPEFDYNPRNEAKAEFERLRESKGWIGKVGEIPDKVKKKKDMYYRARREFFGAFISDFTYFFGNGEEKKDWVFLCDALQVHPVPRTIEDCKTILKPFYVNIFNLLDHVQQKVPIVYHADLKALSEYSLSNGLLFPLPEAKTTCMKFLLRKITISNGRPDYYYDDWTRTFRPRSERPNTFRLHGF